MKNLFLTGKPGIGKTTLIRRLLERAKIPAHGFYTAEIRDDGRRVGFSIRSLDGQEGLLASVRLDGTPRVGKYGVNLADLERVGVDAIRRGIAEGRLVVIDEIGKMELFSEPFRQAVREALDSHVPVVGTLTQSRHPFAEWVARRPDVRVVVVTYQNRDSLLEDVLLPWLQEQGIV